MRHKYYITLSSIANCNSPVVPSLPMVTTHLIGYTHAHGIQWQRTAETCTAQLPPIKCSGVAASANVSVARRQVIQRHQVGINKYRRIPLQCLNVSDGRYASVIFQY